MKSGWRIILVIVLVAILFGGICLGVGMITGADMGRIYPVLDKKLNLTGMYHYITVDIPEALNKSFYPMEIPAAPPAEETNEVYQVVPPEDPAVIPQAEIIE